MRSDCLRSLACVALVWTDVGLALPSSDHVLHEKREGSLDGQWKRSQRLDSDAVVPLRIGLVQQNLESGYEKLMEVSHPTSAKFGQHLTAEEVHDFFQPAAQAVEDVKGWLVSSGIPEDDIVHSDNKGWLAVDIPAAQFDALLRTEIFEHEHVQSGAIRLGCDGYHLPKHIQPHIDYITPGVKFSAPVKKRMVKRSWPPGGSRHGFWGPRPAPPHWQPPHYPHGPYHYPPGAGQLPPELRDCGRNITPACIRALYDIPRPTHIDPANYVGLFEGGDHYSQADIDLFFARYAPNVPQGTSPTPAYIDGAQGPVPQNSAMNGGEADIDIDMIYSLVYPQKIALYQTDDIPQAAEEMDGKLEGFLNTFLDALDGSYCTYSAYGITGDSPGIDAQYPDPLPGGYKGKLQCGVYKPARVISASYGEAEADLPKNYQLRQCNEFMKLSLQGHTILFSSGDYGVASAPGDPTKTGCLSGSGQNQTIYTPNYPVNCPYVIAVGATQLNVGRIWLDAINAEKADSV